MTTYLTGCQLFIKINAARAAIGQPPLLDPPELPKFRPNPVAGLAITNDGGDIRLKLKVSGTPNALVIVLGIAPCSAGISYAWNFANLGLLPAPVGGERHHRPLRGEVWRAPRRHARLHLHAPAAQRLGRSTGTVQRAGPGSVGRGQLPDSTERPKVGRALRCAPPQPRQLCAPRRWRLRRPASPKIASFRLALPTAPGAACSPARPSALAPTRHSNNALAPPPRRDRTTGVCISIWYLHGIYMLSIWDGTTTVRLWGFWRF